MTTFQNFCKSLLAAGVFCIAIISGCTKNVEMAPRDNAQFTQVAQAACTPVSFPVWAGAGNNDTTKGTQVGTVTYHNDSVNLFVTVSFPGPSCPNEIHVWAGSDLSQLPSTKGGMSFGKFPYKLDPAGCGTHTFTIPLSSLFPSGTTDFCNKNLNVVVHAAMDDGETAIGHGQSTFGGSRWGWIATYTTCCDSTGGGPAPM